MSDALYSACIKANDGSGLKGAINLFLEHRVASLEHDVEIFVCVTFLLELPGGHES